MAVRQLEEIVPGDAAFEVTCSDVGSVFRESAEAIFGVMADLGTVKHSKTRRVSLDADTLDDLLFAWLSELVYLKDVDRALYSGFEVVLELQAKPHLTAVIHGERVEQGRHKLGCDVKGVTKYMFELSQIPEGWKSVFVLDL